MTGSPRCLRTVLALGALLLVTCGPPSPPGGGGDGGGAPCREGEHRCNGLLYEVCAGGAFVTEKTCEAGQVCTDAAGCTACAPNEKGCLGDAVVACDANGNPTTQVIEDCSPQTCVKGECTDACSPEALESTYMGCVFYATDLPQWGQESPLPGVSSTAATQQFAIAVANPWNVAVDVKVEQNDAAPGSSPAISVVAQRQVGPSSLEVIPLPQREVNGYVYNSQRSRSALTSAAYRVITSRPTTVYQFNPQNNPNAFSNDASLLIPVNALDANYLVLGWPGMGGEITITLPGLPPVTQHPDNRAFLTIVGARAGTRVRVVPSTHVMAGDGVPALAPGEELVVTLGEFETLNLQGADFQMYDRTDFTGTRIEADGPVAVWSGVECINIVPPGTEEGCCCDHLEEQLYPRSSLGKEYVVVRTRPRSTGTPEPDYFRIAAQEDGTVVQTSLPSPNDQFTLNKGQIREILTATNFTVTASAAVMIGQFMTSQDANDQKQGDPAFILVPPFAQYRSRYIILVPSGYSQNYALMSVPQGQSIQIDGAAPSDCTRENVGTVAGGSYDAVRCPLQPGTHTITSEERFGLIVQGFGPGPVSYGYTGGMDFKSVNRDCTVDNDCPGGEFCSGGTCVDIIHGDRPRTPLLPGGCRMQRHERPAVSGVAGNPHARCERGLDFHPRREATKE